MSDSSQRSVKAALDIHLPEVKSLVSSFRINYDPPAAQGIPDRNLISVPPRRSRCAQFHNQLADQWVDSDTAPPPNPTPADGSQP